MARTVPDFFRWLLGYVVLRVPQGGTAFFRRAVEEGLRLFGISWRQGELRAGVLLPDLGRLRRVARSSRVRVRLEGGHGWPYAARRAQRRPVLALGIGLTLLLWAALSSLVLQIRVEGVTGKLRDQVLQVAGEAGLVSKGFRPLINPEEVVRRIEAIPGILWATLSFDGTEAILEVREGHQVTPPKAPWPQNLVAAKRGIVVRVVVFRGVAQVSRGDAVLPGEILIAGAWGPPPGTLAKEQVGPPSPIADGEVDALVQYEAAIQVPLVTRSQIPEGKAFWVAQGDFQKRSLFHLGGPGTAPYEVLREIRLGPPGAGGLTLRLIQPIRVVQQRIPVETALDNARASLKRNLDKGLPLGARWLKWQEGYKIEKTDLVLNVRATAEENIARPEGERSPTKTH